MADAAAEVWFYHLERSSLDQVLPELLEKTRAKGWKALVRVRDAGLLSNIDDRLWTYRADSFLPHGRDDGSDAERQPVLLASGAGNANRANALFVVDGAEMEDAAAFDRCLVLFDGRDEQALAGARARWKDMKATGAAMQYWRQDEEGGWSRAQ